MLGLVFGGGRAASAKNAAAAIDDLVSVYHKGQLNGGVVSSTRSLSTGLEKSSVDALQRTGKIWEFRIPRGVLQEWLNKGWAVAKRDYDITTGVINEEISFSRHLASQLNKYLIK